MSKGEMIKRSILVILYFFFTTLAGAEFYKYVDKNGEIHVTDNILSVPEDLRNQVETYKEESSETRPDPAYFPNIADQLDLSYSDRCFLKLFSSPSSGSGLTDYGTTGLSRDEFDQLKTAIQQEFGVNDQTVCAFVTPDPRFSTPELTWSNYEEALTAGRTDEVLECFSIDSIKRYKEIFAALGKEKMKEIALEMRPIQKIKQDADSAEYRITRNEGGQEITYYIYFQNMFGNWKIQNY